MVSPAQQEDPYRASPTAPPSMDDTFSAVAFIKSERFKDLDWRERYYLCTQHDHKTFDFNGRIITNGARSGQMLASEAASWYVPLTQRRPSAPYRLGKVIVNRFTSMLFGAKRWPSVRVEGDKDTQDFLEALITATGLPAKMLQARNIGGSVGSVGLSWAFRNGKPVVNVHNAKYLDVTEWADRDRFIPASVTECFQFPKTEWDPVKRQYAKQMYWYRRDWTKTEDIGYLPEKVVEGREPQFTRDDASSGKHGDGFCHFVWIQNLPTDEEDGCHDFSGLEDSFDALDLMLSVMVRGLTLNLDPTLVLQLDPDIVRRMGVKKGSDNALIVGPPGEGDAKYLELGGQGMATGITLFNLKRKTCLEVAECVLTDPDTVAAGQQSASSIEKIYEPMIAKCDTLREQYGAGLKELLLQMLKSARIHLAETTEVVTADGEDEVVDNEGETQTVVPYLDLPPKVTVTDTMDEMGQPTGEQDIEIEPVKPGEGGDLNLDWGPYFTPTPADYQALITALNMATGGKAVIAQQTANEILAAAFGRNPAEEWKRLHSDKQADAQQQAAQMAQGGAFGDTGGAVDEENSLPPGASPKGPPGGDSSNPFAKKDDAAADA